MPIADYETLMLPLLRIAAAANGNEVSLIDAIDQLAAEYRLTDEERLELLPSGGRLQVFIARLLVQDLSSEG